MIYFFGSCGFCLTIWPCDQFCYVELVTGKKRIFEKLVTKPTGQAGHELVMTRLVTKVTRPIFVNKYVPVSSFDYIKFIKFFLILRNDLILHSWTSFYVITRLVRINIRKKKRINIKNLGI